MASNSTGIGGPSVSLAAAYEGSGDGKTFDEPLPALPENFSTEQKTNYLKALRSSVTKMQDDLNTFLTRKMEEDNALAGQAHGLDDAQEEANYGEEVMEED